VLFRQYRKSTAPNAFDAALASFGAEPFQVQAKKEGGLDVETNFEAAVNQPRTAGTHNTGGLGWGARGAGGACCTVVVLVPTLNSSASAEEEVTASAPKATRATAPKD